MRVRLAVTQMSVAALGESKSEARGMPRAREAHIRSLFKAVSWRITGTIDTFLVSFIVTGKPTIAGSIAAAELLTKIALYYGHERLWTLEHVSAGLNRGIPLKL